MTLSLFAAHDSATDISENEVEDEEYDSTLCRNNENKKGLFEIFCLGLPEFVPNADILVVERYLTFKFKFNIIVIVFMVCSLVTGYSVQPKPVAQPHVIVVQRVLVEAVDTLCDNCLTDQAWFHGYASSLLSFLNDASLQSQTRELACSYGHASPTPLAWV
jgi:hypothetical protein